MNLEYLKHKDGTRFYPISHSNGIICEEDKSLTTVIQELRESGGHELKKIEVLGTENISVPNDFGVGTVIASTIFNGRRYSFTFNIDNTMLDDRTLLSGMNNGYGKCQIGIILASDKKIGIDIFEINNDSFKNDENTTIVLSYYVPVVKDLAKDNYYTKEEVDKLIAQAIESLKPKYEEVNLITTFPITTSSTSWEDCTSGSATFTKLHSISYRCAYCGNANAISSASIGFRIIASYDNSTWETLYSVTGTRAAYETKKVLIDSNEEILIDKDYKYLKLQAYSNDNQTSTNHIQVKLLVTKE